MKDDLPGDESYAVKVRNMTPKDAAMAAKGMEIDGLDIRAETRYLTLKERAEQGTNFTGLQGTFFDRRSHGEFNIGSVEDVMWENGFLIKGKFLTNLPLLTPLKATIARAAVEQLEQLIKTEVTWEKKHPVALAVISPFSQYAVLQQFGGKIPMLQKEVYHWKTDPAGIIRIEPAAPCTRELMMLADLMTPYMHLIKSSGELKEALTTFRDARVPNRVLD
jgi:hypothetical protein